MRPTSKRSAVAEEPGTTILVIGGKPDEAFRPLPLELNEAFEAYTAKEYEKSIEVYEQLLQGISRTSRASGHLRAALQADDRVRELIRTDTDLDSLRDDSRFADLIA